MARLHLELLGNFQARVEPETRIALPTRKSQALLAYLALPPGRAHGRDKLASLLWGDMADRQARGGLRQALSALRKLSIGPTVLVLDGDSVALDPASVDVDVVEFERRVAEATPDGLARAVSLYRGDLLEDLALREAPFEEWLLAERERLRQLALDAFAKLLRLSEMPARWLTRGRPRFDFSRSIRCKSRCTVCSCDSTSSEADGQPRCASTSSVSALSRASCASNRNRRRSSSIRRSSVNGTHH